MPRARWFCYTLMMMPAPAYRDAVHTFTDMFCRAICRYMPRLSIFYVIDAIMLPYALMASLMRAKSAHQPSPVVCCLFFRFDDVCAPLPAVAPACSVLFFDIFRYTRFFFAFIVYYAFRLLFSPLPLFFMPITFLHVAFSLIFAAAFTLFSPLLFISMVDACRLSLLPATAFCCHLRHIRRYRHAVICWCLWFHLILLSVSVATDIHKRDICHVIFDAIAFAIMPAIFDARCYYLIRYFHIIAAPMTSDMIRTLAYAPDFHVYFCHMPPVAIFHAMLLFIPSLILTMLRHHAWCCYARCFTLFFCWYACRLFCRADADATIRVYDMPVAAFDYFIDKDTLPMMRCCSSVSYLLMPYVSFRYLLLFDVYAPCLLCAWARLSWYYFISRFVALCLFRYCCYMLIRHAFFSLHRSCHYAYYYFAATTLLCFCCLIIAAYYFVTILITRRLFHAMLLRHSRRRWYYCRFAAIFRYICSDYFSLFDYAERRHYCCFDFLLIIFISFDLATPYAIWCFFFLFRDVMRVALRYSRAMLLRRV